MAISLVEPTQSTDAKPFTVYCRTTLEADLTQAFVKALAQRPTVYFGVELAPQFAVTVSLECGIWSSTLREKGEVARLVWIFASFY